MTPGNIPRKAEALDVLTITGPDGCVIMSEYMCDVREKVQVDTLNKVRSTLAELVVRGHLEHLGGWEFRATDRGAAAAFASSTRIDESRRIKYRRLAGLDEGEAAA